MKITSIILKIIMLFIGCFFIVMAFDSVAFLEFIINASPGIGIMIIVPILWKREFILSIMMFLLFIVFFLLFGIYELKEENTFVIFTILVPTLITGIFLQIKYQLER